MPVEVVFFHFEKHQPSKNIIFLNKESIDIKKLVLMVAKDFYRSKNLQNWEQILKSKKINISDFSNSDLDTLFEIAINSNLAIEQRTIAIYFLNAYGAGSGPYLKKVFLSPVIGEKINYEYSLRTMALEGLEAYENYSLIPKQSEITDPYLKKMLTIVRLGEISHKPLLHLLLEKIRKNQPGELVSEN